jgi:hypothetical protein
MGSSFCSADYEIPYVCGTPRSANKNEGVAVRRTNVFNNSSQHVSAQIGHHQLIFLGIHKW